MGTYEKQILCEDDSKKGKNYLLQAFPIDDEA